MNLVTCSDDDFQQYAKSVVSMYWRHELMSGVGAVAFGYLGIAYADWFITVLSPLGSSSWRPS
jgi:hypothetical protein